MNERFELSGERNVHEYKRQRESDSKKNKYLIHLPGHAGRPSTIIRFHIKLVHKTIEAAHSRTLRSTGQ